MSTMRVCGPRQHINIDYNPRLTGAQRVAGLARAGHALGTSAAQAVSALCTLPLLPTGAPLWLGLRAASNLKAGLFTLGHAVAGAPPVNEAVDGDVLSGLCMDVLHMCEAGAARRGCDAAVQLLSLKTVDLGAWRGDVILALREGVTRATGDVIAQARASCDEHVAQRVLYDASAWLQRLDETPPDGLPFGVRVHSQRRIDAALVAERMWWRLVRAYDEAMLCEERGDRIGALRLLHEALRSWPAHGDGFDDDARLMPLREMLARLQTDCVERLRAAMDDAVAADDWRGAQHAAESLLGLVYDDEAFAPDIQVARSVRAQARALVGDMAPTFEALERALRALRLDTPWRQKQVDEARILLGPADDAQFATLADEIIATFKPPENIGNPRVIHARLPHLFYHPERNRHGPYIKLVPQTMLAMFDLARRKDGDDPAMPAQRDFVRHAFVDLCFEGRAAAMMDYLVRHPLEEGQPLDDELVLDVRGGMDDEARATEHFRVYNVVQLRRFAVARGMDVKDAAAFSAVRAVLEADAEYTRDYCNAERFARYLAAQDFVRDRADADALVPKLIAYLRDTLSVL